MTCRWIWTGTAPWDPDPRYPHACPAGQHCPEPPQAGGYIGEEATTTCTGGPVDPP